MRGGGLVFNAIINHYLYALIHEYEYKFYQAQYMPDHHNTWIMPHALRELIPNYQFAVAIDADVTLAHLDVPLEWLLNRWGVQEHTSMALPWDTLERRDNKAVSLDSQGLLIFNTGFFITQNSNLTLDMLEKWRDCTSGAKSRQLSRFSLQWKLCQALYCWQG
jgi:hypothetical protein